MSLIVVPKNIHFLSEGSDCLGQTPCKTGGLLSNVDKSEIYNCFIIIDTWISPGLEI